MRNHWQGFLKPMAVLFAATLLLMIRPTSAPRLSSPAAPSACCSWQA